MTTLGPLTVPPTDAQIRLGKNALPAIAELERAIADLQTAIAAFRGTHDNRKRIEDLAGAVLDRSWALADVSDSDLELAEREQAFGQYRAVIIGELRALDRDTTHVFSDDASVQFPLKVWLQSVRRVHQHVSAFALGNDNRPAIISAVRDVLARLDDVKAMRVPMAEWRYSGVETRCAALLKALERDIPESNAVPAVEYKEPNVFRSQLSDELWELRRTFECVGASEARGGTTEALEGASRVDGLIRLVRSQPFETFTEADPILAGLAEVQSDAKRLLNVRCKTTQVGGFLGDGVKLVNQQLEKVRSMVKPSRYTPATPPTLVSRIAGAFGWGEDGTEAA